MTARSLKGIARSEEGASAVEFAIVSIPLVTMLIGAFELAMLTFTASTLESAALDAARFGAIGTQPASQTRKEKIRKIIAERTFGFVDMRRLQIDALVYNGSALIG